MLENEGFKIHLNYMRIWTANKECFSWMLGKVVEYSSDIKWKTMKEKGEMRKSQEIERKKRISFIYKATTTLIICVASHI